LNLTQKPLVTYNSWVTLAIFAAALALINTFIKPIISFFSLPLTCMTLGLFALIINTAMFALAAWLVPDFNVSGFWGAFMGALAVSVVGLVVNLFVPD